MTEEKTPSPWADKWILTVQAPNGLVAHYFSDPLQVDAANNPAGIILGGEPLRAKIYDMWKRRDEVNPNG